ncbi:sialate O-acetylesterase [Arenibacter aquaticus]|uniref:Sialate O-acetylesterase n=1 Tax=Arenibacter aquaticus TaxID=2489054 RepID=A0A3S0CI47_9FLAO|nr:sialate O-acetylesterase [Arenibacter aquaticus]RTE51892.1 sialate O-acetylesterase [Arenibacter aquaticus]
MSQKKLMLSLLTLGVIFGMRAQEKDQRTQYFPKSELRVQKLPPKDNVWVFVLAGQSNMAGRGQVEPKDTIPDPRVLTLNRQGNIILAKEPLHFYEPSMAGLDCGLALGKAMLKNIPDSISVLLIPTAVGGSSISKWLEGKEHRQVNLLSNFMEKVEQGKRFGAIKGIFWHQGESDAKPETAPWYEDRLRKLFTIFREIVGKPNTPIVIGQLGSYSTNEWWPKINEQIKAYVSSDSNAGLINTSDLEHKGDEVHFNSEAQRTMGERYARAYFKIRQ